MNRNVFAPKRVAVAARENVVTVDYSDRQAAGVVLRQRAIGRVIDKRFQTGLLSRRCHTVDETAGHNSGSGTGDRGVRQELASWESGRHRSVVFASGVSRLEGGY